MRTPRQYIHSNHHQHITNANENNECQGSTIQNTPFPETQNAWCSKTKTDDRYHNPMRGSINPMVLYGPAPAPPFPSPISPPLFFEETNTLTEKTRAKKNVTS